VRDYGLGVPPEQAVLLFQRFVRLERDIASNVLGSGLGLAICRAYIEAMGGRIWVESDGQSGNGSTFKFTLPVG
ncbi:MAG TPA: ATP-binding protein, partial [Ktedonobacterales bacterium]|nr:ATP-binding protein [Ktedonobacterales bacterium]